MDTELFLATLEAIRAQGGDASAVEALLAGLDDGGEDAVE